MLKNRIEEVLAFMVATGLDAKIGVLAKLAGVTSSAASHWQSGVTSSMSGEAALNLEKRLGYRAEWLMKGRLPKRSTNVRSVKVTGVVPLISWEAASSGINMDQFSESNDVDKWIETYESEPGGGNFALRVIGDAMVSASGEHSFSEGTIIIVNPDRRVVAGDFVLARDPSTQRATFRRLTTDGNRWHLQPLNPAWASIEVNDLSKQIIGRVMEWKSGGKL